MSVDTLSAVADLEPIHLDELNDRAALQTRVDRKYVIDGGRLAELTTALVAEISCRILTIDDRSLFAYRSTYFDTPGLDSYLEAVRSRPSRSKVRVRSYLDTADTFVEVKTRRQGGATVKTRIEADAAEHAELSSECRDFVRAALGSGLNRRAAEAALARVIDLSPVLVTEYSRATLCIADCGAGASRATIDTALSLTLPGAEPVGEPTTDRLLADRPLGDRPRADRPIGDRLGAGELLTGELMTSEIVHGVDRSRTATGMVPVAIIETKSAGGAGAVDRFLWSRGVRPTSISKFGIGMAIHHPQLPSHKWHRTINTYLRRERELAA